MHREGTEDALKFLWMIALSLYALMTSAQTSRDAAHLAPTGKGWGEAAASSNPPIIGGVSSACEEQTKSPNGDSGADAMASIMAHETNEAISDPNLNAWYDTSGNENSDKCAWKWGPVTGTLGNGGYNMTAASHHWLIQMNWENARGGGCDQALGGKFYGQ
jgi:hypothetical protein